MFRVLMSVSDKAGLVKFAKGLESNFGGDLQIISTGGTSKTLKDAAVPVVNIEAFTGVPEVMDGRVKTINHKIAGGILADCDKPEHVHHLKEILHSAEIHMVVVNLYPFVETAKKPDVRFEDVIENIDIGGPGLLRAAVKNFLHVIVLADPCDYPWVLSSLSERKVLSVNERYQLAKKAIQHTADYDTNIAIELPRWAYNGISFARA